jgi:hypothetical protein
MKRHGGYAAQAKRRNEEWIACTDCTTHSRATYLHPHETWPQADWSAEDWRDFILGIPILLGLFLGIPFLLWLVAG